MNGRLHQFVRRLIIHLGNQPKSAGILLKIGGVKRALKPLLSVHAAHVKTSSRIARKMGKKGNHSSAKPGDGAMGNR
jgi:hypothetical protein